MIGELRIERDGGPPHRVEIAARPLILGASPNVDIQVNDQHLSRQHCKVEVVGRRLVVTDLGSSDGTYARGQRISQVAIEAGEAFFVGKTRITFDVPEATTKEPTVAAPHPRAATTDVASTIARPLVLPRPMQVDNPPGPAAAHPPPARTPAIPGAEPGTTVPGNGSMIEGYQILRRLGEGSMGTAYLARSLETGTECVLKTIHVHGRSKDAIFFIREVQVGTKLDHPNIVRVVDFGESGGLLFLAMEYVEGGSLLHRIEEHGRLGSPEALGQLIQLSNALDYASRKKVVHRDIKPANILLTADGLPRLADFGLAKMLSETRHAQLTQTGEARGTPVYMAPEILVSAANADARADIYSLGATYYHALAGQPPFDAGPLSEVLRNVAHTEPERLDERNPDVHPAFARVIRRMMCKRLDDRYPSASKLVEDLKELTRIIPFRHG